MDDAVLADVEAPPAGDVIGVVRADGDVERLLGVGIIRPELLALEKVVVVGRRGPADFEAGAVCESPGVDRGDRRWQGDDAGVVFKGIPTDGGQALVEHDVLQRGTAIEREVADGGYGRRQCDRLQGSAVAECAVPDLRQAREILELVE